MPARTGMTTLIAMLRALCAAGTADHTLNGVSYWSDEQLQAELDTTRRVYYSVPLLAQPEYDAGVYRTFDYAVPTEIGQHFEESGANSGFAVRDSGGNVVSSASYTVNFAARRIHFNTDQRGVAYFLDARAYALYRAAASVWSQKAAFAATRIDWSADNHDVRAGQEYAHCMAQAERYQNMSGLSASEFRRVDEV